MKKIFSIFLVVIILTSTLVSCEKTCRHEYENGVCKKCDVECEHTYTDGVCSVCEQECEHAYADGICSVCAYECKHTFTKGICSTCSEVNLAGDVMNGRKFEYSYYEFTWATGITEEQKEAFRKKYNVDTDEELFKRYYEIFIGDWLLPITPDIIRYDFYSSEQVYALSKDNHGATVNCTIDNDLIKAQTKPYSTLHYRGEYVYSLKTSINFKSDILNLNETKKLDKEIALKFVYLEK